MGRKKEKKCGQYMDLNQFATILVQREKKKRKVLSVPGFELTSKCSIDNRGEEKKMAAILPAYVVQ